MSSDMCEDLEVPDTSAHVRAARDRAAELCALPADWDGADGHPISAASARHALELVAAVTCPECLPPTISPTSAGNLLVDWTWGDEHVEVEVFADGRLGVLARLSNEVEQELELNIANHGHLAWLGHRVTGVGLERFDEPVTAT